MFSSWIEICLVGFHKAMMTLVEVVMIIVDNCSSDV